MSKVDKVICDNCKKQRPPDDNTEFYSYGWVAVSYSEGNIDDKDFCSEACLKEFYKDK